MSAAANARRLAAVDETDESVAPEYQQPREEAIGDFEGQPVHFAKAKVTSAASLEIGDRVLHLDDKVVLVLELRCARIDFPVDQNTGKLTRLQTLRAIDAFVANADFETLRQAGL